ncbi:hypothetical protein [Halomarina pelagica]|uniref:hypothetical protein n=1 Tax=Halomarina pelagica TaxID=2961599 RepID=UPI0020C3BDEB|nr:hypothetical protein [Halomarina sp. BND7]
MDATALLSHIKACTTDEGDGFEDRGERGGLQLQTLARSGRHLSGGTAERDEVRDVFEELRRLKRRVAVLEREQFAVGSIDRRLAVDHELQVCDACGAVVSRFAPDGSADCPGCDHGVLRRI